MDAISSNASSRNSVYLGNFGNNPSAPADNSSATATADAELTLSSGSGIDSAQLVAAQAEEPIDVPPNEASDASGQVEEPPASTASPSQQNVNASQVESTAGSGEAGGATEKTYSVKILLFDHHGQHENDIEGVRGDCTLRTLMLNVLKDLGIRETLLFSFCEALNEEQPTHKQADYFSSSYTSTYQILNMATKVSDLGVKTRMRKGKGKLSRSVEDSENETRPLTLRLCCPLFAHSSSIDYDLKALNNLCDSDLCAAEYYFWQVLSDFCNMLGRIQRKRQRGKKLRHLDRKDDFVPFVRFVGSLYGLILERDNFDDKRHQKVAIGNEPGSQRSVLENEDSSVHKASGSTNKRPDENTRSKLAAEFAGCLLERLTELNSKMPFILIKNFSLYYRIDVSYTYEKAKEAAKIIQKRFHCKTKVSSDICERLKSCFHSLSYIIRNCVKKGFAKSANQSAPGDLPLSVADLNSVQIDAHRYLSIAVHNRDPWLFCFGFESVAGESEGASGGPEDAKSSSSRLSGPLCRMRDGVVWSFYDTESGNLELHLKSGSIKLKVEQHRATTVHNWLHVALHAYDDSSRITCPCLEVKKVQNAANQDDFRDTETFCEMDTDFQRINQMSANRPCDKDCCVAIRKLEQVGEYVLFATDENQLCYRMYWLAPSRSLQVENQANLLRVTLKYDAIKKGKFVVELVERLHSTAVPREPVSIERQTGKSKDERLARAEELSQNGEFIADADLHHLTEKSYDAFDQFVKSFKNILAIDPNVGVQSMTPPNLIKCGGSRVLATRPPRRSAPNLLARHVQFIEPPGIYRDLSTLEKMSFCGRHVYSKRINRARLNVLTAAVRERVHFKFQELALIGLEGLEHPHIARFYGTVTAHNKAAGAVQQHLLFHFEMSNLHRLLANYEGVHQPRNTHAFSSAHFAQVGLQLCDAFLYLQPKLCYGAFHFGNVLVDTFDEHSIHVRLTEPGINHLFYEDDKGDLSRRQVEAQEIRGDTPMDADKSEKQMYLQFLKVRKFIETNVSYLPNPDGDRPLNEKDRKILEQFAADVPLFCDFYGILVGLYVTLFYFKPIRSESGPSFSQVCDQSDNFDLGFVVTDSASDDTSSILMSNILSSDGSIQNSAPDDNDRLIGLRSYLRTHVLAPFRQSLGDYIKAIRESARGESVNGNSRLKAYRKAPVSAIDAKCRDLRELYRNESLRTKPFPVVKPGSGYDLPTRLPFPDVYRWFEQLLLEPKSEAPMSASLHLHSSISESAGIKTFDYKYAIEAHSLDLGESIGFGSYGWVNRACFNVSEFLNRFEASSLTRFKDAQFIKETRFWQFLKQSEIPNSESLRNSLAKAPNDDSLLTDMAYKTLDYLRMETKLELAVKFFKYCDKMDAKSNKRRNEEVQYEMNLQSRCSSPYVLPLVGGAAQFSKEMVTDAGIPLEETFFRDGMTLPVSILPLCATSVQTYLRERKWINCAEAKRPMLPAADFQLTILNGVLCGLKYLRQSGIVHGDVAARNTLISSLQAPYGVVIGDFGLAKVVQPGDVMIVSKKPGNRFNLPPEAIGGEFRLEKTDIWGFGVLCWEVLTACRFRLDAAYLHAGHLQGHEIKDLGMQEALKQNVRLVSPIESLTNSAWTSAFTSEPLVKYSTFDKAREDMYQKIYTEILVPCWNNDVSKRPSIEDCEKVLLKFLSICAI